MLIVCAILTSALFLRAEAEVLFETAKIQYATADGAHRIVHKKNIEYFDESALPGATHLRVMNANMPRLHEGSFRNMASLQVLQIPKCFVATLDAGAFRDVPNLDRIQMQDNVLTRIESGVFNFLNVSQLFLQRNQIGYIAPDAFDDMPRLHTIKLNKNKIAVWDANWFNNVPELSEVYFRRNYLESLPDHAFKNFKRLHHGHPPHTNATSIYLSSNKLQHINPSALKGIGRLNNFYIDRNNITEIPHGLFHELHTINYLGLRRNKLTKIDAKTFEKVQHFHTLDIIKNDLQCVPETIAIKLDVLLAVRNLFSCECIANLTKAVKLANRDTKLKVGKCSNDEEEVDEENDQEYDDEEDEEEEEDV